MHAYAWDHIQAGSYSPAESAKEGGIYHILRYYTLLDEILGKFQKTMGFLTTR